MICFFTERHSLLTQVAFMSFTRHCFFRSQVYRGLSGRHCLGTSPRPLVTPTSSAAELPFEGQSVGAGEVAASERASDQVPVSRRRARATCHIGGDGNELLSQKGAPLAPPVRCRFLHVVYVSRAADDADVAAAPAPPTAARAAAAAGSATHAAARCNRPKKTGKKFRKTKTAATAKNEPRGCPDGGGGDRRSALRAPRRAGAPVRSRRNRARPRPLQGTRCTKTQAPCLHFRLQRKVRFPGAK